MSEFIEIHFTAASIDEARRISRYLVQERLVACSQIVPWIESIYMWNNQLETAQESKIVLKTISDFYPKIKKIILENTSYEVPEVTVIEIKEGHEEYLSWIKESTSIALET